MKTRTNILHRHLAALAISSAFVTAPLAMADEPIAVNKLPEVINKAIKDKYPNAELLSAERDTDKGKKHYEVQIRDGGKVHEVEISPEGTIIKVEKEDDK